MKPAQTGFGLVEIMIALLLGIIIMLGITQVATNNSKTRYELERAGRQIESAAYALRLLENDLTSSGYWGEMGAQEEGTLPPVCPVSACYSGPLAAYQDQERSPDLTHASCTLNRALRFPVQGGTGDFNCDTVEVESPTDDTVSPKVGSDYLAIRRANSCAEGDAGCELPDDNFHLQVNSCFNQIEDEAPKPGFDYYIHTDLTKLRYQARSADTNCAYDAANEAPKYRLLNRIYYITPDDQLMRAELVGNQYVNTLLVEGVEMMRLEYGLDSAGADGLVDTYTDTPDDPGDPADDADWADVVMVRITLVVRNMQASSGFVDNKDYTVAGATYTVPTAFQTHRRQVYTRTVSLRNVAGRRE